MKNSIKLALAAVVLSAATWAQAAPYVNGDLLIGFNTGPSGSDYIADLGNVNSLTPGQQWNLGTLFGFPLFSAGNPNRFGAFAYDQTTETVWTTASGALAPTALGTGTPGAGGSIIVLANAGVPGNNNAIQANQARITAVSSDSFQGNFYNQAINNTISGNLLTTLGYPDTLAVPSSTTTLMRFWQQNYNESVLQDNYFTYNTASGMLQFGPVPEPSTYALFGGFGVLALLFRRRFAKV